MMQGVSSSAALAPIAKAHPIRSARVESAINRSLEYFYDLEKDGIEIGHTYYLNMPYCHFHREIEIVQPVKGRMYYEVDGDKGYLSEGEILFINKGVSHMEQTESPQDYCSYIKINVDRQLKSFVPSHERLLHTFAASGDFVKYKIFKTESELHSIFKDTIGDFAKDQPARDYSVKGGTMRIIAFMINEKLIEMFSENVESALYRFLPVAGYVTQNYSNNIELENVCKLMNINKYHFCHLFKKATGSTFNDFVTYVRIYYAEKALGTTNDSISSIAFNCGFNSIQNFTRVFKKHKFISPKEYRKSYGKSPLN